MAFTFVLVKLLFSIWLVTMVTERETEMEKNTPESIEPTFLREIWAKIKPQSIEPKLEQPMSSRGMIHGLINSQLSSRSLSSKGECRIRELVMLR